MPDDPTPEEIVRVDEWRKRKSVEESDRRQREENERKEAARLKLEEKLRGRTIAEIHGFPRYLGEWRDIEIVFEDGGSFEIEASGWGDGPELDFSFEDAKEGDR